MGTENNDIENSILKVYSNNLEYSNLNPCNPPHSVQGIGSGFVVEVAGQKYVVTNAHVISGSANIKLSIGDESKKYDAKLAFLSNENDLALLAIEDKELKEKIKPLKVRKDFAPKKSEVMFFGYPIGGQALSESSSKISRIEVSQTAFSGAPVLAYELEGFGTFGNSGGPVVLDNEVIGVFSQGNLKKGYAVASPVLNRFLKAFELNKKVELPIIAAKFQYLSNKYARSKIKGLDEFEGQGIRVAKIENISKNKGILKEDDIILELANYKIRDDGKYKDKQGNIFNFTAVAFEYFLGDKVPAVVLRDGKLMDIELSVDNVFTDLTLAAPSFEKSPSYLVKSGVVFQELTADYLKQKKLFNEGLLGTAISSSLEGFSNIQKEKEDDKVIFINFMLPLKVTDGYHHFTDAAVKEINGISIKNWDDVIKAIYQSSSDSMKIKLDGDNVVLDIPILSDVEDLEVLSDFHVYNYASNDVKNMIQNTSQVQNKGDFMFQYKIEPSEIEILKKKQFKI